MHRLFFAFFPGPETIVAASSAAAGLTSTHGRQARLIAPERLHVTVIFVGEFDVVTEELIALARSAAEQLDLQPFEIVFDQIEHWADSGATVLSHSADAGRDEDFVPHMTIGYHLDVPAPIPVPPIRWRATEFALVHSIAGQPVYEILGRWPLRESKRD